MDQTTLLIMGLGPTQTVQQVFGFKDESFLKSFQSFEFEAFKKIDSAFCIKAVDQNSIMACRSKGFTSKITQ